jgi:transcriptional regulator with XRE-family HTH domain
MLKIEAPLVGKPKTRRDSGFGGRIRAFRTGRGLTLQKLSDACGLAASTISKVEQNQISPTYENILRLADGLGVDVAELFSKGQSRMTSGRRSITRAGQGARLTTSQYGYEMLCADLSGKQFIPLLTTLRAHDVAEFPDLIRHEGEEFIYVVSGRVRLLTEFYEPIEFEIGDSCYFDSTMGHVCLSAGAEDATILWVCSRLTPQLQGPLGDAAPNRKEG